MLLVEIVSHHDGRAFGLDLFSLGVDELVVQREAFVTHPDDSGAYGDRLVAAGLDEVVRLACNDDQSGRFPVRSQAEHLLVKVALPEVEIVLLIDVVDVPQYVDVGEAHLYLCLYHRLYGLMISISPFTPTLTIDDAFPVGRPSHARSITRSTPSTISFAISLNDIGDGLPEILAEVETSGRFSL